MSAEVYYVGEGPTWVQMLERILEEQSPSEVISVKFSPISKEWNADPMHILVSWELENDVRTILITLGKDLYNGLWQFSNWPEIADMYEGGRPPYPFPYELVYEAYRNSDVVKHIIDAYPNAVVNPKPPL